MENQVAEVKKMLAQEDVEPDEDLDAHCHKPYDCAFWQYCSRHLPEKSVFSLYRMNFGKKIEYYQHGVVSFEQLNNETLNEKQQTQVNCTLNDTKYINKVEIAKFLSTLSYPLYFLDFETMQPVIPEYQEHIPTNRFHFSIRCII